jgi:energy-coupling factor transport system permease protein
MTYLRRATPLHATRAAVGAAYCVALAACAIVVDHPLVLGALLAAVLGAGVAARCLDELRRVLRYALPLAVVTVALNPLFSHQGLTVLARLGEVPPFGELDVTLEALVFGAAFALKLVVVVLALGLFAAAVDPDEVLRLLRRVSLHSALTASLATRLWTVLERDGRRIADAQRCRADWREGPERRVAALRARAAVIRAVAAGALERAVDVAATLEVRGYGSVRRPPRLAAPWSRHDLAFAAAALALVGMTAAARLGGLARFDAYPTVHGSLGAREAVLAAALLCVALAPFADRRGVQT